MFVGQWKKDGDNIRKQVEEGWANKKQALADNGLRRVRLGIKALYKLNKTLPRSFNIPLSRDQFIIYLLNVFVCFVFDSLTNSSFLTHVIF